MSHTGKEKRTKHKKNEVYTPYVSHRDDKKHIKHTTTEHGKKEVEGFSSVSRHRFCAVMCPIQRSGFPDKIPPTKIPP